MIFTSNEIDVFSRKKDQINYLCFKFKGKFTEEASKKTCAALRQYFEQELTQYVLIWDCLNIDGFEIDAKKEWVKALDQLHNQISSVTVISDNILIRGASRLMLKLYRFDSTVVKSHAALDFGDLITA